MPPTTARAHVDADAEAQGRVQLVAERLAQLLHARHHRPGGRERLAAAGVRPAAVDPEERHHAVAGELIDDAARVRDGAAHRLEVAVEEEDDVVGELVLGQPGEAAQIGEEHRDLSLRAVDGRPLEGGVAGRQRGREQRHHREVARGAAADRPAARWAGAPTRSEHAPLVGAGRAADAGLARHTRTRHVEQRPRPPHTEACGMPREAARLEHREARRHHHLAALGIADADRAAAAAADARGRRAPRAPRTSATP